jgi:transposase-like protein
MAHYTFKQFQAEYPDDAACLDKILKIRHGGHEFTCPGCGADSKFHRLAKRRAYSCQHCGHHVYPCVGTPFEKSRTPLTSWFFAMYLMTSTRHGVAAKELQRQIGCTYKTAWRMAHELRKHMANADYHGPMSGHVEVDETLIGGRARHHGKGKGRRAKKTVVFGILQRDGIVRAGPVPNETQQTLEPIILQNVQRGSKVSSDGHLGYADLKRSYEHGAVNHSAGEYVRGEWHTNSIEGYWSRLKNSIKGTHIHVSRKHLWKYVSEFSYRYNNRKEPDLMFNLLVSSLSQQRLVES